jgi:hypothetical protein
VDAMEMFDVEGHRILLSVPSLRRKEKTAFYRRGQLATSVAGNGAPSQAETCGVSIS